MYPKEAKYDNYSAFLQFIDELTLCPGCPEPHFVEMCKGSKGKSRDRSGKEVGYLDSHSPVEVSGQIFGETVRSSSCQMIVTESRLKRCKSCREFRPLLRASYWKKRFAVSKAARSEFTSNSKLRTPNRTKKMNLLATQRKAHMKKIRMLKQRIQLSTDRCGVRVQAELHDKIMTAIRENDETITAECGTGTLDGSSGSSRKTLLLASRQTGCVGTRT